MKTLEENKRRVSSFLKKQNTFSDYLKEYKAIKESMINAFYEYITFQNYKLALTFSFVVFKLSGKRLLRNSKNLLIQESFKKI